MSNKPINAGKYRHRITIKDAPSDSTRDTFGRRKGTGATVCTVWAEKQDWQGGENTEGKRETASVTTKWLTRFRTDVAPEMQIVHGEDVYSILSVLDFDGRKRELVLTSRRIDSE
jgi:SPP1 family predicted phage head-tail adaptor